MEKETHQIAYSLFLVAVLVYLLKLNISALIYFSLSFRNCHYIYINHILLKHIKLSVQNYMVNISNIVVIYNKETYDMNCKHVMSTSLTNIWYNFTSRMAPFPRNLVDSFLKKSWIGYSFKNRVSGLKWNQWTILASG